MVPRSRLPGPELHRMPERLERQSHPEPGQPQNLRCRNLLELVPVLRTYLLFLLFGRVTK